MAGFQARTLRAKRCSGKCAHIGKHVPLMFAYDCWPWFYRSSTPALFQARSKHLEQNEFIMLAKFRSAKLPSDFRPIASVRILYEVFTYMALARIEPVLEANQPEEQHGFRGGRRLEEHLVSANLVIDKLLAVGKPVWIVSLDLSKAFDRVNWSKLWAALTAHRVSQHLVWIIQCLYQCLYWKQEGCVKGDTDASNCFPINSGVRQRAFWAQNSFHPYSNGLCENGGSMLKMHIMVLTCKMIYRNSWI